MAIYRLAVATGAEREALQVDCGDDRSLKAEVAMYLGELLKDRPLTFWDDQTWQIEVADAAGLILYVVNVDAFAAPAAMRHEMPAPLKVVLQ